MPGDEFNFSRSPNLESFISLAQSVKKSEGIVQGKLNGYLGRTTLWLADKQGQIPDWARHHIVITKQLERAIKEVKAHHQVQLPSHTVELIKTTEQLVQSLDELESQDQTIPSDIQQTLNRSQETVRKLAQKVKSAHFLESIQVAVADKNCVDAACLLVGKDSSQPVDSSREEWHLNLGLLMNVYQRTEDPELKKQISFLALNYLAKAAPINIQKIGLDPEMTSQLEDLFQFGLFQMMGVYYRATSTFESLVQEEIKQAIAPQAQQASKLVLTDTTDVKILLPTKFSVLNTSGSTDEQLQQDWTNELTDHFVRHLNKSADSKNVYKNLDPPLLLDLTDLLGDVIQTQGDRDKNQNFEDRFGHYESLMDQAVSQAVQKIKAQNPTIFQNLEDEKKLEAFLRVNIICMCSTEIKGVGCIKVLPMFYNLEFFKKYDDSSSPEQYARGKIEAKEALSKAKLDEFVNHTGIRLGGVRGREKVFNFIDLPTLIQQAPQAIGGSGQIVEYAELGANKLYFTDKLEITRSALFRRFESHFTTPEALEAVPSHVRILGQSTLQLVKGLLAEISDQKWIELNANPDKRQLIQTTLFRLVLHLAQAENNRHDFAKFSQAIELVHCEIATLLAIASPFKEEDFSEIYKRQLNFIPKELEEYVKVGVSKSAMNAFAGINAAIKSQQPDLERVYSSGSYFEEAQFIGWNRTTQKVLQNPSIDHIDLYVGEFNQNLNIDPKHNEYQAGDIQGEVEALLQAKPHTEHLTVAVDCTVDYLHSGKGEALLKHFSQQIQEGKLNFVFFRSGQKFDMLGMDNYYGAPFFMINNGNDHWKSFDDLLSHDIYKTDPLSMQWFSLINKVAPQATDAYRQQIFENTRRVLDRIPEVLKPGGNSDIRVCTVAENMDPCFIDIKLFGNKFTGKEIERLLYEKFIQHKAKIHSRGSFGFFHANVNVIPSPGGMDIRINPGLNPSEVDILVEFLKDLAIKVEPLESPIHA